MGPITYATREDVLSSLDMAETSRSGAQVDRLLQTASLSVELLCHRRFYPEIATRYFPWPDDPRGSSYRLWLDDNELISLATLTSDDLAITDYFLEPQAVGPPYNRVELDLTGTGSFATGQRAITIAGTFGYTDDRDTIATLAGTITSSATTLTASTSVGIGTGSLLRIGAEYLTVTVRNMIATGVVLGAGIDASKATVTLTVTDGTLFALGEVIRVDAERMRIVDTAATALYVERAHDATVLAAHLTGAAISAPRSLTVARGQCGSTAAAHTAADAIAHHRPPAPVVTLVIDEVLWKMQNEQSGMARVIGIGDAARQVTASGIKDMREEVRRGYARAARKRAI